MTSTTGVVSAYLFGSHAERPLHRASDVDLGAFLRDTVLRAADIELFLKRMRRLKLAALVR